MMQQKDSEFLIWLAKRLVYKYKENTDIIRVVQSIIEKYGLEQSLYYDMCNHVHKNIAQVIIDLSNINQDFITKIEKNQTQIKNIDINHPVDSIFEHIDFDKIMRKS